MKRILLVCSVMAGFLIPAGAMAQQVSKDGVKIILDLTETMGMPADAITAVSKTAVFSSVTPDPNNTSHPDNETDGPINATVYEKLEIAPGDLETNGNMSGSWIYMTWEDAFNGCKNSTFDGGRWRLPTQRELMLMWIFRGPIDTLSGSTSFSSFYYWSSTENYGTYAWIVYFGIGDTFLAGKTNTSLVRCVREK